MRTIREVALFTPIHRALSREPGELTHDLIDAAVAAGVREADDLDWKKTLPHASGNPEWDQEFAKDVAAMANSGGGWLVYGVREDRKTSAALEVVGVGTLDQGVEQRLRGVAYGNIRPAVRDLQFLPVTDPERGDLLVVRVPASPDVPHLLSKDGRAFRAPRRYGAQTEWMGERDLELAYRERFRGQSDRQAALESLLDAQVKVARLRLQSDWPRRIVVVGAAVPVEDRAAADMGVEQAGAILNVAADLYTAMGDLPPGRIRDLPPERGMRRYTAGLRGDRSVSVHLDGAVSLRAVLLQLTGVEGYGGLVVPVLEVEQCVARLVATIGATGRALGVSGAYMVKVVVVWNQPEVLRFAYPDPNISDYHHLVEPAVMVHDIEPATAEIPADGTLQVLSSAARQLTLDLLHQGGMAQTRFVS